MQATVKGGKSVYGAAVGILMLDSRFPRIPGDIGNAATWPFPVLYKVVRGASPDRVVRGGAEGLAPDFIAAARELVADGADGITTTCGFLTLFQGQLADAAGVPVAASSLLQVPFIERMLPAGRRVGVITISQASLTDAHLASAGVALDSPVIGTENGSEFSRVILNDEPTLDIERCRADILDAGRQLCAKHPEVGAIVLECTNMVPFAADLREQLRLPVYSIYSFITWFQAGLLPRRFEPA